MKNRVILQFVVCMQLVFVMCFGMIGCTTSKSSVKMNKDYSFVDINGNHFLVFDDITLYRTAQSPDDNMVMAPEVGFLSVKEFKDSVTKGTLSKMQKQTIARFSKDSEGRIKTCDFNNLYAPTLPTGQAVKYVGWLGERYYFLVEDDQGTSGSISLYTEDSYKSIYERDYENFFDRNTIHVTDKEYIDDSQKEVTYYYTSVADFKRIRYSLSDGEKTIIIDKQYSLTYIDGMPEPSSAIPAKIYLYGEVDGQYYRATLRNLKEDPTDAWLLSFGLEKYVDK